LAAMIAAVSQPAVPPPTITMLRTGFVMVPQIDRDWA
jgi:hypothetical protein